jgi:hypothetical protein
MARIKPIQPGRSTPQQPAHPVRLPDQLRFTVRFVTHKEDRTDF